MIIFVLCMAVVKLAGNEIRSRAVPFWMALPSQGLSKSFKYMVDSGDPFILYKQYPSGGKVWLMLGGKQRQKISRNCRKDLCEICEFNTPVKITLYRNGVRHDDVFPKWSQVGTHTGRKTFICFALSNGIAPDVVMKFTGHCDYKSMRPYIDITESAKKDAIKKMEEAFKKK